MISSLSLFAGISLGCSVGYGFGGCARQIAVDLSENKEHLEDGSTTFWFREGTNKIVININDNSTECTSVVVTYNDKKYIFKIQQFNDRLVASCNIIKGIEFMFYNCGPGRTLSSVIDDTGRCFISIDSVTGTEPHHLKFESIGMKLTNSSHNTQTVSQLVRQQVSVALFVYANKYNLLDSSNLFDDIKIIKDRYNALILFSHNGEQKVIYLKGSLDHTVDIVCEGTLRSANRFNLILPDRIDDDSAYSVIGYEEDKVIANYSVILKDDTLRYINTDVDRTFSSNLYPNKYILM